MEALHSHNIVEHTFTEIIFEKRPCLDRDGSPVKGLFNAWIMLNNPKQYNSYTTAAVKEVILATNFTVEGEATAHYVSEMFSGKGLAVSRIARGLPVGGEIEHVDAGTLAQALIERRPA